MNSQTATKPPVGCPKAPCGSCPYRKDVPSGIWSAREYDKLPAYDGEMVEQIMGGAHAPFFCHQRDGNLCAGWVACHGAVDLAALRLTRYRIDPAVFDYKSPVPVFASGAEARAHGIRDIERPGVRARRMIAGLVRKLGL
jgi:hypothetical protein